MHTDMLPDFLHLYHACSNRRLLRLLAHYGGDATRARRAGAASLRALGLGAATIARIGARSDPLVERDLEWSRAQGNRLVCYDGPAYPPLLREIDDHPALLYARGRAELLAEAQIAIVGSRLCTPGGANTAFEFAEALAAAGITVTSGMALGIDTQAHRGALAAGGYTIAVVATGIDLVYPARNRRLADEILRRGLMISEFPLGQAARRISFPQRNRIISGLALGTLVVEAGERSGSLISARFAAEQGREVFAVPGSINNPQTRGCHALLRDGACLAESPADIARELGALARMELPAANQPPRRDLSGVDDRHRQLLQAIGYDPVDHDTLAARSGLTIEEVSSMLLLLELNDLIQPAPGGCYVRI